MSFGHRLDGIWILVGLVKSKYAASLLVWKYAPIKARKIAQWLIVKMQDRVFFPTNSLGTMTILLYILVRKQIHDLKRSPLYLKSIVIRY